MHSIATQTTPVKNQFSLKTLFILALSLLPFQQALSQECEESSPLPERPWYTGISSRMQVSMGLTQEDGVHTDFHGIWMHSGWKNNLGPCAQSYPWTEPSYFQEVIDAGKIPVVYWWWHFDNPQSISLRQEAEQQLRDCLVPFLNEIDRPEQELWIVLQPEYNMHKVHEDPSFATHLIQMIDDLRANVTGVKIKVGPCPGNFGNMEDRYRLHASLEGVLEKSDFIAFHDIQRASPSSDAAWNFPVPGQVNTCLSFCRFLKKEFNKPIFFAYWSVANQHFGQDRQAEALIDIFSHQAEFESYGVFGFGPFWYQSESGFSTEGLKSPENNPYQVWHQYKDIVNKLAAEEDYIHSMSFLDIDYGSTIEFPATLKWISTGKNGPITYSLYYETSEEGRVLIAENLTGSSNEIMKVEWEPCNLPTSPLLNLVVVADDNTECTSPKVSYNNPESLSDATFDFEDNNISSFEPITSGASLATSSISASGSSSLQINLANEGKDWSYTRLVGPVSYTGENTLDMMIYVPYSLNNTMNMGEEVTHCSFYMQTTETYKNLESPSFGLNQGWNNVTWDYQLSGNDPQEINLLEIRVWNRMPAHEDQAKILIDDLKFGGQNTYSRPSSSCTSTANQLASCQKYEEQMVGLSSSISDQNFQAFFPNPFENEIHFPDQINRKISIVDIYGNEVFTESGNFNYINTSSLISGSYIMSVFADGQWTRYQVIKI